MTDPPRSNNGNTMTSLCVRLWSTVRTWSNERVFLVVMRVERMTRNLRPLNTLLQARKRQNKYYYGTTVMTMSPFIAASCSCIQERLLLLRGRNNIVVIGVNAWWWYRWPQYHIHYKIEMVHAWDARTHIHTQRRRETTNSRFYYYYVFLLLRRAILAVGCLARTT